MITLLLLIVGMLSGCGNDSNGNRQDESVQTAEPTTKTEYEEPTTEPEAEETEPKFDVAQDVLLSYEYDSDGELSKIAFEFCTDMVYAPGGDSTRHWEWKSEEINATYDESGYLKSIETESKTNSDSQTLAISANYNADGQIISLTARINIRGLKIPHVYYYEVVYNSDDIKVYINQQRDSGDPDYIYNETCTYDMKYNPISKEMIFTSKKHDNIYRVYAEYTNGVISHKYRYNDSTGILLNERLYYDNGHMSEEFDYDSETGDLKAHTRYDRNGERIN